MSHRILIAEDESISRKHLTYALEKEGYEITGAKDGTEAFALFDQNAYDMVIADIKMPGMDGLTLLDRIKEKDPDMDVIIITGFGSIESAVEAMRKGASEYVTKPFNLDELNLKIAKVLEKKRIEKENTALKITLGLDQEFPFIAKSRTIQRVVEVIRSITGSDCNVLLTGESGVGKGLVAKIIHHSSARKEKLFLALNCAIFTEELLASELFGHEKGAFTGAVSAKKGLLEIADSGTLFLDEIAEMSPTIQAKLLKVIEDREFIRVGGTRPIRVDVRFIAATNQNLPAIIKEGKFREDLYYRLNVMDIYIPPLRERREDIVPLSRHFLQKYAKKENKKITAFNKDAMETLMSYGFPGNVRELENIVERAVILEKNRSIHAESLPQTIKLFNVETISPNKVRTIEELNREYAERILDFVDQNRSKAAELLGISRTSLWRILKR
ncbi:MAG TPA: sigma-54 dependent transcriptional regulator [Thermodesulfovibrionales bacterium]|nr:sigma-54 dependent transcriptional regulator [Thermodesulfovibrionales bacterium]